MGSLEKLQRFVLRRLETLADLGAAEIFAEGIDAYSRSGNGGGLSVTVTMPEPRAASKYAAGPVFSHISLCVCVERDNSVCRALSILDACEIIAKALHKWGSPVDSGYGRLELDPSNPWTRHATAKPNSDKISVNFTAQSVIQ